MSKVQKKRTCGNCQNFTKWKYDQISGRAGLCEEFDYTCKTDASCSRHRFKKYKRKKNKQLSHEIKGNGNES